MDGFLNNGFVQVIGVFITAFSAYGVAKFNRTGAKEANQTAGWTNLVAALQKRNDELEKRQDYEEQQNNARFRELDTANRDLAHRTAVLERSRRSWKVWAQRVAALMSIQGITLPETPETLEDTDPKIRRSN